MRRSQTLRAARVLTTWLALAQVASAQAPQQAAQEAPPQSAESMARATTKDEDMTDQQARSHFRLGREYYQQGRFPDAAREFEVAYGLSGRAALLYNVYISYRDALDTPKAAAALRGYLAAVPDAPDRENLSARLAALESQVAQSQADAERAAAQRRELERLTREAEAKRAEPVYSAPPAAAPSRPWWPWLVVGAGVVATATGVTLGALASHDASALREQCVTDPRDEGARAPLTVGRTCAPTVDLEKRRDSIQTQALVGDVLWIGGAALTLTGLALAVLLPANERTDAPPLTAACAPGSCQATLHLSF